MEDHYGTAFFVVSKSFRRANVETICPSGNLKGFAKRVNSFSLFFSFSKNL